MRKISFATGEIYHLYNRGVDKRSIFDNGSDIDRFLLAIEQFNTRESIGSIYENQFRPDASKVKTGKPLVKIIAFCLNKNHYHFILEQIQDGGISKFMHKLGMGHTKFFNAKYRRSGALFQGEFKSAHIASNEDLLRLSVYVNWNDYLHRLGHEVSKSSLDLCEKSFDLYVGNKRGRDHSKICFPEIVLEQFGNQLEYKKFADNLLPILLEQKEQDKELEILMLEDLEWFDHLFVTWTRSVQVTVNSDHDAFVKLILD